MEYLGRMGGMGACMAGLFMHAWLCWELFCRALLKSPRSPSILGVRKGSWRELEVQPARCSWIWCEHALHSLNKPGLCYVLQQIQLVGDGWAEQSAQAFKSMDFWKSCSIYKSTLGILLG